MFGCRSTRVWLLFVNQWLVFGATALRAAAAARSSAHGFKALVAHCLVSGYSCAQRACCLCDVRGADRCKKGILACCCVVIGNGSQKTRANETQHVSDESKIDVNHRGRWRLTALIRLPCRGQN